ncbi:MAG: thioredoxin family protein [bacterium]|nr:thioredoxin family protein [bacterium]
MKIEILGIGCAKCKQTYANAEKAVSDLGISAEIVKVEKIDEIMKYSVMMTPAVVVDGVVKCSGKMPTVEEIKSWIKPG